MIHVRPWGAPGARYGGMIHVRCRRTLSRPHQKTRSYPSPAHRNTEGRREMWSSHHGLNSADNLCAREQTLAWRLRRSRLEWRCLAPLPECDRAYNRRNGKRAPSWRTRTLERAERSPYAQTYEVNNVRIGMAWSTTPETRRPECSRRAANATRTQIVCGKPPTDAERPSHEAAAPTLTW